jgi:hypothetical protein
VRLLVLDHYFRQDIESLEASADAELRVIDFSLLRDEAMRIFPAEVASGLEAFARPEYEAHRVRFANRLRELMEELFSEEEFDAFVSPSDAFFYVRAAPEACHALGVPFFVVQKETTISDHTMRAHAETVRRFAPPVADYMTVCSERHRSFWLRAGADPTRVTATGQPRFDYYARPADWPPSTGNGADGPVVLFFSYLLDAYHPAEGSGEPVWGRLHRETEEALWELARRGWRVLVKPHPQQDFRQEQARIEREVGALLGRSVSLLPADADARPLIVGADVIVGFQTTALLESLLVERPVVYTGWDEEATKLESRLIPFHRWDEVIDVVLRPSELVDTIESARGRRFDRLQIQRRREIATSFLGPVDGGASQRALAVLADCANDFARRRSGAVRRRRAALAERRPLPWRRVRRRLGRARTAAAAGVRRYLQRGLP